MTAPTGRSGREFPFLPRRETRAGRAVVCAAGFLERIDPSAQALALALRSLPVPGAMASCVYRRRNAARVAALAHGPHAAPGTRWQTWALDAPAAELAGSTLGTGPGARLQLHERMLAAAAPRDDEYWVVADDDVELPPRGLSLLLRTAVAADLDVCAPSHAYTSLWSHRFTLKRPLSLARLTHFVEIGPVVVLSPRARSVLLPFPTTSVAGWGMESYWSSLRRPGLRLGLVDAVTVRHLTPMGTAYDSREQKRQGEAFVQDLGVEDFESDQRAMMTTVSTWRPEQRRPPWLADGSTP